MTTLKDLQTQLRQFPCHFIWDLEKKSMKQFKSLMDSVNELIAESPAMVIEGLLFKSYLFFSDFRGNAEKKKTEGIKCLKEVRGLIQEITEESIKDGYLAITLANEAWLERRDKNKLTAMIISLSELESKYEVGSYDHKMFTGSIYATRGFALSRVGMNRYSESIENFQKAVDMCPNMTDWWFSLGHINMRIGKASTRRSKNHVDYSIREAESIFYNVLHMDYNHSYALVQLAEIKRRKHQFEKAEYFLKCALRERPHRKKILAEVGQVYRRMEKYPEALEHLHAAENMGKPTSFIYHQLHHVYRNMNTPPPVDYLQMANDANPSNMAAKFDQVQEFISKQEYLKGQELLDNLLDNYENDPLSKIQTLSQYALLLEKIPKQADAIEKFEELLDLALDECKEKDVQPYLFAGPIDLRVTQGIQSIRCHFKNQHRAHPCDKESLLKLAELEKKLGNTHRVCLYYQKILELKPVVDAGLRWRIYHYISSINTSKGRITDANVIYAEMDKLNITDPNHKVLDECRAALVVLKGTNALQNGRELDGLNLLVEGVEAGSLTGARLLLDEVKKMVRSSKDFYIYCAHIAACIRRNAEEDNQQLKEDLDELLSADTSDVGAVLEDLRKTQFNMERCIILQQDMQLMNIRVDVIHKCRIILNQTMAKFRDRHYKNVVSSCDFFNIPKCKSAHLVKQMRNKFQKKYDWTQFGQLKFPDLFNVLVSIQPASNPQENNWLFALFRMDNANKHEGALGEKLKVEVYLDKFGKMAEQEFTTVDVAREACDKIRNILDEFYKYLK